MPNIKSQKKRVLTSAKENAANKAVKSNLKSTLKKAEAAFVAGEDKKVIVDRTVSTIDKAAKKGVISKNAANHKKAALAKRAAL
ncbi:MAG: 30S ribosomal protein S20 [Oscillospiraceae bacterium]